MKNKQQKIKELKEKIDFYENHMENNKPYTDVPISIYEDWKEDLKKFKDKLSILKNE